MKDYNELVRRSIRKDFAKANFKRNARIQKTPKDIRRITQITKASGYYVHRKMLVGKLVRIIGPGIVTGYWIEFVHDSDRDALNRVGGWKDKRRFLLDGVNFDK